MQPIPVEEPVDMASLLHEVLQEVHWRCPLAAIVSTSSAAPIARSNAKELLQCQLANLAINEKRHS